MIRNTYYTIHQRDAQGGPITRTETTMTTPARKDLKFAVVIRKTGAVLTRHKTLEAARKAARKINKTGSDVEARAII
jgi:ribosomal protein L16/L10AE